MKSKVYSITLLIFLVISLFNYHLGLALTLLSNLWYDNTDGEFLKTFFNKKIIKILLKTLKSFAEKPSFCLKILKYTKEMG